MSLKDDISRQTNEALKAGDKLRVSTLRLLSASIKNREVELLEELDDEMVGEVAVKEAKRRREAIEAYEKAGRPDLAEKEAAELDVLSQFLPAQLSDAEIEALVDEAITRTKAATPADMGKVMGAVMSRAKGKADGALIQRMVREKLETG